MRTLSVRIFIACGLVGFGSVCFPVDPAGDSRAGSDGQAYRIQPLDTLQIAVFQEPELSLKTKVASQGTINYPLLGTIGVGHLTVAEAEEKITALLADGYLVKPRVTVTVEASSRRRVVVLGQIKTPGTLDIPADESLTLLQAIAKAGGFTGLAATDRVSVLRTEGGGQKRKIVVNVAAIIKRADKSQDIELQPGDVVSVPETLF